MQIEADEISEITRNQTRGMNPICSRLCNLSNLCLSATDTNDRMARTTKRNMIF
jgi:hypothetical protein